MSCTGSGTLWLMPNALDFGMTTSVLPDLRQTLPLAAIEIAARTGHWVVENARSARQFLKRVDAVVPLGQPLQSLHIVELPRPRKGSHAPPPGMKGLLEPARRGSDIALLSEAGLPAVADPGAALVEAAHGLNLTVLPLAGASSLLLALAASGLNGQSFAFVGYLPVDAAERALRIRELEALSRRAGQTQLMIETPYRNPVLLDALLAQLQPATRLSVSCGITLASGWNRSDTVAGWRRNPHPLPADVPAVFALLA